MVLFGKKKSDGCCGCGGSAEKAQSGANEGAEVKVLGSGCKKCNELEANVKAALEELGMDTTVSHVTDFAKIAAYGVMSTPALVLGTKVVSAGRVLKKDDIIALIKKHG